LAARVVVAIQIAVKATHKDLPWSFMRQILASAVAPDKKAGEEHLYLARRSQKPRSLLESSADVFVAPSRDKLSLHVTPASPPPRLSPR
jgi:hypothetical protein